jgi:hypothetical protein
VIQVERVSTMVNPSDVRQQVGLLDKALDARSGIDQEIVQPFPKEGAASLTSQLECAATARSRASLVPMSSQTSESRTG